ncbi:fibrinogen-like protein 1 isoform X2 [Drosophila biarmipes]|uniref:fibrinogen-like protein 1 isoform X2 n=1 Tax=Drosophila biarmipes TaxID=125945 RepID=UPI0007E67F67|nr:fibrinogen-like protein 1 isoform X2 [Drosophila biarmipes]
MMRPQLVAMAVVMVLAVICGFGSGSVLEVPEATERPPLPPRNHRLNQTRSHMRNNFRSYTSPTSPPKCDYKEMMTNLHDRVGILVTLDEDQRHRLEVIDQKLDRLVESSSARMESMKVQQLDFKQRLDSFEHIQRLSRNTLDELKDLSRTERDAPQDQYSESGIPVFNESSISVAQRLDALATLLTSTALQGRATQIEVGNLAKLIKIQLRGKGKKSNAVQPPVLYGPPEITGPASGQNLPSSCKNGFQSQEGILKLRLSPDSESFYVMCDGDWTVIMSRSSDNVSFERGWLDYRDGFGNLVGDFFIGLNKLHALTASSLHELQIVLEDFAGNEAIAQYSVFAIGSERELYPLSVLGHFQEGSETPAGDSLSYHAGARFSTVDQDNDNCIECNCALKHKGAGWFVNCATSNLFGQYITRNQGQAVETGMWWDTFSGQDSLKSVRWMIRPVPESSDDYRR